MTKPTVSKHWRKPVGRQRSGLNPTRTTSPCYNNTTLGISVRDPMWQTQSRVDSRNRTVPRPCMFGRMRKPHKLDVTRVALPIKSVKKAITGPITTTHYVTWTEMSLTPSTWRRWLGAVRGKAAAGCRSFTWHVQPRRIHTGHRYSLCIRDAAVRRRLASDSGRPMSVR